jgi:selenocysteine lyase/cysteine desulfurase
MKAQDDAAYYMNGSRRDFLKILGVVTAGGLSTLALPGVAKAGVDQNETVKALLTAHAKGDNEAYWRLLVKNEFILEPGLVYLNTGTEGSMPRAVLFHIRHDYRQFASFPMDCIINDEHMQMNMELIRTKVAEFVGATKDEIVLTTNTTEGLGWVANGLDLFEGDEVITTTQFNPYNMCWQIARDRRRVQLTEIELPLRAKSNEEIIDLFEEAITPQTKVLTFCHINFTNGLLMPVKEICELARSRGIITVVDGAHTIGQILLNFTDLGCDFYAASPHKWLCAPPGTGILYLRKEMQKMVWPTVTEAYFRGVPSSANSFQLRGQQSTPAYSGLLNAMDLQNGIGRDLIRKRILALSSYAKQRIIEVWGEEKLFSPMDEGLSSGLVSFNPFETQYGQGGDNISKLYYGLYDQNIITRSIGFKEKLSDEKDTRALRFSTHIYNSFQDIDKAIEATQELIKTL